MQIAKVKLVAKGTKGLSVSYHEHDKRGPLTFNDEFLRLSRAPITPTIRAIMISLESHAKKLLQVHKAGELTVTGVISNGQNVQLVAEVVTFDSKVFTVCSALMQENTLYAGYKDMIKLIDQLYEEVTVHLASKQKIDTSQIIMDLQQYGDDKIKATIGALDIAGMSDEEKDKFAIEHLEKKGALVMLQDEHAID